MGNDAGKGRKIGDENRLVVVIVVDCFTDKCNGTAVSANNLAHTLRAKGHIVRVVAPFVEGEGACALKERWIPLVTYISHKQHMHFGEADESTLRAAFEGADIVHLFLPFKLEITARKVAQAMKIPYIAGFHLQPENITYNAHLTWIPLIHRFIFWLFKVRFYRHIRHIHCPSKLIESELKKHHYNAKLFVISNGFTPHLQRLEKRVIDELFHITMTGRYTQEKRQDLLINAVLLSKYESRIKLHIKGLGPREEEYRRLGARLTNGLDLGFASDEDLAMLYSHTNLYVHTSDVDGESISALEAIASGLVPIIADSKTSATKQFAIDERSLFVAGDAADLARKIDYFIENPSALESLSKDYENLAKNYELGACVDKMIDLYREAIRDFKTA